MATTPVLLYWKVLKEPTNGAKIAGKKGRKLGDIVRAAEAMMRMQALEGVVGECDSAGVLTFAPAAGAMGATGAAGATGATGSGGAAATGH